MINKFKILLADDNKSFLQALKLQITDALPGRVEYLDIANNGQDAIELIKLKNYHIVFMDIDMPIMNGVEATKYINKQYPSIVVVALSMYNDFRSVETMILAGSHNYISKDSLDENSLKSIFDTVENNLKSKK